MRVSVLGMGSMGHSLAERLTGSGHDVTVWNRSPGKAGDLVSAGAIEAQTPVDAVSDVDAVFTFLADDAAVRAVLLPDGVPLPVDAAVTVNCTTVSPETTALLAAAYPDRFVAAPVLGAPAAVRSGQATYALAGAQSAIEELDPMWEALGGKRLLCGSDPTTASTVKLISNSMLLSGLVVTAEAVATAQAAGLDPQLVRHLFANSPMVAPGLANRLDDVISGDHDHGWFAMPLGAKDLDLFVSLAASVGIDASLATTARDSYRHAAETGLADKDVAGVIELFRR